MTSPKSSKAKRRYNDATLLSAWREKNNLSQQEAADLIGITQVHFSYLERGIRKAGGAVKLTIERIMTGQIKIPAL